MPPKSKTKQSVNITNWYEKVPEDLLPKYHNPNFDQHKINVPFRAIICAASGGGKTNLALEMLHRMKGTFNLVVLCCKDPSEPLYAFLQTKLDKDNLHVYPDGQIPHVKDYEDEEGQSLIIFDDLVVEPKQTQIKEWFIRGRKVGKGGFSCMYLTQSYFGCPKIVRLQANLLFLKKLTDTRDLKLILSTCGLGMNFEELLTLYKYCTQNKDDFLLVDLDKGEEERYRKGFLDVLHIPST